MYKSILERLQDLQVMSNKDFRNTIISLQNCPPNKKTKELIEAEREKLKLEIEFLKNELKDFSKMFR